MRAFTQFAALAALGLGSIAAQANPLFGSHVNYQYYYPDLSTPVPISANGDYKVGTGVEITNAIGTAPVANVTMDITAAQIIFTFLTEGASSNFFTGDFSGWVLSDADDIDDFTSVTIDASSSWGAFDTSRLSFTEDSISANLQGLTMRTGDRLVLNVVTAAAATVPEPASLALTGLAFASAGMARRRQKRG